MHLKMLSAEVVCCKYLPSIADELSIQANSVDPEQTAPRSSLISFYTVCHRGFLNISAEENSRRILLRLAHYGLREKSHTLLEKMSFWGTLGQNSFTLINLSIKEDIFRKEEHIQPCDTKLLFLILNPGCLRQVLLYLQNKENSRENFTNIIGPFGYCKGGTS